MGEACLALRFMDQPIRQFAAHVIEAEAAAVRQMTAALDDSFERAVHLVLNCRGSVLTSGVGKAGFIARKLAATMSSTGTPSHFLNPGDALHGDVGVARKGDVVLIMSYSGESDEVVRMLSVIKKLGHPTIAITGSRTSSLARFSDVVLTMGQIQEACPLGLAPSATTTAMLALSDALALTVMKLRHFTAEDFAVFHPAGQLGRKLIKVKEAMTFRKGENLPVASDRLTVGQVLAETSRIKRRSGAVILVDGQDKLSGIFTDGDLRRLLTDRNGTALSRPISEVMKRNPKVINAECLASQVMALMKEYRIDEVPVVDDENRPVGLIDVQDLVVLKMFDVEPEI
ncbi:MAG: KpsF/GutQ family sugar-phosphate isomerase [Bacillota bacterium]